MEILDLRTIMSCATDTPPKIDQNAAYPKRYLSAKNSTRK